MLQTFAVSVPPGLSAGQQFRALLGEQVILILIPAGVREHELISVQVHINPNITANRNYAIRTPRNISPGETFPVNIYGQVIWLTCPAHKRGGDIIQISIAQEPDIEHGIANDTSQDIDYRGNFRSKWPEPLDIPPNIDTIDAPNYLVCPITQCLMKQPAITPYGITYDYFALNEWLRLNPIDPATNRALTNNMLYPNRAVRFLVEEFIGNELIKQAKKEGENEEREIEEEENEEREIEEENKEREIEEENKEREIEEEIEEEEDSLSC